MDDMLLQVVNANKHFGVVHVLKNVDFDIKVGEVHCLVGPNGCGKSTLIKIISGVYQPDAGTSIIFEGKHVAKMTSTNSMDKKIQVIYQDLSVFPNLTVAENISFFLNIEKRGKGVNWDRVKNLAKDTLKRMKVDLPLNELVENLSIAERQLIAIARALATNAKLIIMDEPTSSLTRAEIVVLFDVIRELKASNISVIFVSHKLNEIIEVADRVTVVRDGEKIGTFFKDAVDYNKLVSLVSGQELKFARPENSFKDQVVLKVEGLTRAKEYSDISFELRKGEILGIFGPLGSGRTEIALSLFGMTKPDSGRILIDGRNVSFRSNVEAIKSGIAYLPEDRLLQGVVLSETVENNISISIIKKFANKIALLNKPAISKLAQEWMDKLTIRATGIDAKLNTMSGGNQQKVVLAKWLATNPKVLILDEPTNGVDIGAKSAIYEIIKEFAKRDIGVILISSEEAEIYNNCNRILLIRNGRISNEIITDEVSEEELMGYAR